VLLRAICLRPTEKLDYDLKDSYCWVGRLHV